MNGRILLIILTSCVVCSMKVTTRVQYGSLIISLDIENANNMSHASITCFHLSDTEKILFHMQNGEMTQSFISNEYKGRVRCNRSERKVDLELLNFTKDDEGNYLCNFYDGQGNSGSESFKVNGPQTNDRNSVVTTPAPGPAATGGTKQPPEGEDQRPWIVPVVIVVVVVVAIVLVVAVVLLVWHKKHRKHPQVRDQDQNGDASELQNLHSEVPPSQTENGGSMIGRRDDSSCPAAQDLV